MSTSAGAIYTTDNAGRNWKAQVRETTLTLTLTLTLILTLTLTLTLTR